MSLKICKQLETPEIDPLCCVGEEEKDRGVCQMQKNNIIIARDIVVHLKKRSLKQNDNRLLLSHVSAGSVKQGESISGLKEAKKRKT